MGAQLALPLLQGQCNHNDEPRGKEPAKAFFSAPPCPSSGHSFSCPIGSVVLIFIQRYLNDLRRRVANSGCFAIAQ